MLVRIKYRCYNLVHRNFSHSLSADIQYIYSAASVYITGLPEAVAITAWTKWDFKRFLNYHGAAVAIHLIRLQFLRCNSIKANGLGRGISPQIRTAIFSEIIDNGGPHQESKQFQNSHFRSKCPLRVSLRMELQKVRILFVGLRLSQHTNKGRAGCLMTLFFWIFITDRLIEISEKCLRNHFSWEARGGEVKWVMGQIHERLEKKEEG